MVRGHPRTGLGWSADIRGGSTEGPRKSGCCGPLHGWSADRISFLRGLEKTENLATDRISPNLMRTDSQIRNLARLADMNLWMRTRLPPTAMNFWDFLRFSIIWGRSVCMGPHAKKCKNSATDWGSRTPGEDENQDFRAENPRGTLRRPAPIIWYHFQLSKPKSNHLR